MSCEHRVPYDHADKFDLQSHRPDKFYRHRLVTIREVRARVSENQVESNHKRALQIVRDAGSRGLSRSEFTRRTQFMDHRQRDGVLHTLAEARLIELSTLPTGGRPSQWIKLPEIQEPEV